MRHIRLKGEPGAQRETRQKRVLREILLDANRPLTPEDIVMLADASRVPLSIATVYRNLKALSGQGQVTVVNIPGERDRYELSGKLHHHHFHCRDCDRVFDIPGCPGNLKRLAPRKFQVESHQITLSGLCSDCRF